VTDELLIAWEAIEREGLLPGGKLILGGIVSTDESGLDYLDRMVSAGLPSGVAVGYHTYRQEKRPWKPHDGFSTREAEFHRLQAIAGDRELWHTEVGWHTCENSSGWWPCKRKWSWTDDQVLEFLECEAGYNRRAGAKSFTVFQMNDGPGSGYENHFGIRRIDGTLKPSAMVAQRVRT